MNSNWAQINPSLLNNIANGPHTQIGNAFTQAIQTGHQMKMQQRKLQQTDRSLNLQDDKLAFMKKKFEEEIALKRTERDKKLKDEERLESLYGKFVDEFPEGSQERAALDIAREEKDLKAMMKISGMSQEGGEASKSPSAWIMFEDPKTGESSIAATGSAEFNSLIKRVERGEMKITGNVAEESSAAKAQVTKTEIANTAEDLVDEYDTDKKTKGKMRAFLISRVSEYTSDGMPYDDALIRAQKDLEAGFTARAGFIFGDDEWSPSRAKYGNIIGEMESLLSDPDALARYAKEKNIRQLMKTDPELEKMVRELMERYKEDQGSAKQTTENMNMGAVN